LGGECKADAAVCWMGLLDGRFKIGDRGHGIPPVMRVMVWVGEGMVMVE
jgi:hypothetical protein